MGFALGGREHGSGMSRDLRDYESTPFARLAMAHAASVIGDACLTVALAGSIFFSLSPGAARPKVLLYLVLTVAPFAVVAPVIGPALDRTRGGRRMLVVVGCLGRAVICFFMARNLHGLLLFPLAFGALVLSKGQSVAKSSLVPTTVRNEEELVEANSRLALITTIASLVGGLPAAGVLKLFGAEWSLYLAMVVFVVGAVLALRIDKAGTVAPSERATERAELMKPSITLAASAMAILRGAVGFLTFLVAFSLKQSHEGALWFGVVLVGTAAGGFLGVIGAPLLRRKLREETMLAGAILLPAIVALFAARSGSRLMVVVASGALAFGAGAGKLAFDSLLQRDGPDEMRGRAFARFETRFQLAWVAGALIPVALLDVLTRRTGFFVLALVLGFAGLSYAGALRSARAHSRRPAPPGPSPAPEHPDAATGNV
jgi:MFS family permease